MIKQDTGSTNLRRSSTGRFVSATEADVHAGQRHAEHLERQAADARWLAWQIGLVLPGFKAPKLNRALRDATARLKSIEPLVQKLAKEKSTR